MILASFVNHKWIRKCLWFLDLSFHPSCRSNLYYNCYRSNLKKLIAIPVSWAPRSQEGAPLFFWREDKGSIPIRMGLWQSVLDLTFWVRHLTIVFIIILPLLPWKYEPKLFPNEHTRLSSPVTCGCHIVVLCNRPNFLASKSIYSLGLGKGRIA